MPEGVIGLVISLGCLDGRVPVPLTGLETIGAEALDVGGRFVFEDRLDDVPADPGRSRNAVRIAAAGHHEAVHVAAGSDDEPSVGGEGRPAFEDAAHSELVDLRHFGAQLIGELGQHVPVGLDRGRVAVAGPNSRGSADSAHGSQPPHNRALISARK